MFRLPDTRIAVKEPDSIIIDSSGVAKRAESIPETWIAKSLHDKHLSFKYQTSRRGGRSAPGGIIVDFIVYAGIVTALEYAAKFWHSGSRGGDESLKWAFLAREFDRFVIFSDEPLYTLGAWSATDVITDQESSDLAIAKYF